MTLRFTILLLFLLPFSLSAQENMKFGKIPSNDLKMTIYEQDTSAAAVVLGETGNLYFELRGDAPRIKLDVHRRIKILKRAGFDEGDIAISYYKNGSSINNLKIKAFNPDGSNITIAKGDIFTEKINDNISVKKFSIPNLREGTVIDYKYTTVTKSFLFLRTWFFQEDIPVRFSEYTVKIPTIFDYVKLMNGGPIQSDPPVTSIEIIKNNTTAGASMVGAGDLEFVTTRYYATHLPAMKQEPYVTTMGDYLASIKFQISTISIPRIPIKNIMTSWIELAEDIKDSPKFGDQYLNKNRYSKITAAAAPTISKAVTDTEKIKAAYSFVLNNVEWNGFYSLLASDDLHEIYKEKSGTSTDVNLMLLALLKDAGIKANPVLISTRDNGKVLELYPFLRQFDHMMILVEADGESYFLDATNKNRPVGYPKVNSLNKRGWLLGDESKWIDIIAPKSADIFMTNLILDTAGNLSGDFTASCSGYSGFNEREAAKDDAEGKYWQERLTEFNTEVEISDISYEGMDLNDKSLKAKVTYNIPEAAQVNGDFMYLSPIIYSNFPENPFRLENRIYPVEIPYPFKEQFIINLTIPEGYAIEELPEQANLALPNNGGKYQYLVSQKENTLQIIYKISMNQLLFSPEEYKGVKDFFDMIMEKQGEQIVLKKI